MLIFLTFFIFLLIPQMAFAWGPGIHTLISFNLLDELKAYGSVFYPIVSNNFWEARLINLLKQILDLL